MNRRLRRQLAKAGVHAPDDSDKGGQRTDVKHGVCAGPCGRRTVLWLPAKLCEACLLTKAEAEGVIFNEKAVQTGGQR